MSQIKLAKHFDMTRHSHRILPTSPTYAERVKECDDEADVMMNEVYAAFARITGQDEAECRREILAEMKDEETNRRRQQRRPKTQSTGGTSGQTSCTASGKTSDNLSRKTPPETSNKTSGKSSAETSGKPSAQKKGPRKPRTNRNMTRRWQKQPRQVREEDSTVSQFL
jgi:Mg-chelatase subunit ChlI